MNGAHRPVATRNVLTRGQMWRGNGGRFGDGGRP
jgi:hypothetical protein